MNGRLTTEKSIQSEVLECIVSTVPISWIVEVARVRDAFEYQIDSQVALSDFN